MVEMSEAEKCEDRAGAGVFSDILNVSVRESYALGSPVTVFQSEVVCSEYCIMEGIVNRAVSICSDSRAAYLLALKSHAVSSRVVLQCKDSL
jgi:hypothetical protein